MNIIEMMLDKDVKNLLYGMLLLLLAYVGFLGNSASVQSTVKRRISKQSYKTKRT